MGMRWQRITTGHWYCETVLGRVDLIRMKELDDNLSQFIIWTDCWCVTFRSRLNIECKDIKITQGDVLIFERDLMMLRMETSQ
jgi:hypothetical protein